MVKFYGQKNKTSFNSEIRFMIRIFVVDTSNNLHSFSTQTGKKIGLLVLKSHLLTLLKNFYSY